MRRFLQLLVVLVLIAVAYPATAHHTRHSRRHHRVVRHAHIHTALPDIELPFALPSVTVAGELAPPPLNPKEVRCLGLAVYLEARGEPLKGQIAVANVIMNRVRSGRYPPTVCGVVNQSTVWRGKRYCQFSWRCGGPKVRLRGEAWIRAQHLARLALRQRLPHVVGDALSFHVRRLHLHWHGYAVAIGHHVFFSPTPIPS